MEAICQASFPLNDNALRRRLADVQAPVRPAHVCCEEDGHSTTQVGVRGQKGWHDSRWMWAWTTDTSDHHQTHWVLREGNPEPSW